METFYFPQSNLCGFKKGILFSSRHFSCFLFFSLSKSKLRQFQELPGNASSGETVNKEYFQFSLNPVVDVIHLNLYKYGLNKGCLVNIL